MLMGIDVVLRNRLLHVVLVQTAMHHPTGIHVFTLSTFMFKNQLPCEVRFEAVFRELASHVGKTISSFNLVNL